MTSSSAEQQPGAKKLWPWEIKTPGVVDSNKPATRFTEIPQKFKPHWSVWKVDGSLLEKSQKQLASKGLSDPWARNYVHLDHFYKHRPTFFKFMQRGMRAGFVAFCGALYLHSWLAPKFY